MKHQNNQKKRNSLSKDIKVIEPNYDGTITFEITAEQANIEQYVQKLAELASNIGATIQVSGNIVTFHCLTSLTAKAIRKVWCE